MQNNGVVTAIIQQQKTYREKVLDCIETIWTNNITVFIIVSILVVNFYCIDYRVDQLVFSYLLFLFLCGFICWPLLSLGKFILLRIRVRVRIVKYIKQVRVINPIEQGYDTHTHFSTLLLMFNAFLLFVCTLAYSDSKSLWLSLSFLCVRTTLFCFL